MREEDVLTPILPIVVLRVRISVRDLQTQQLEHSWKDQSLHWKNCYEVTLRLEREIMKQFSLFYAFLFILLMCTSCGKDSLKSTSNNSPYTSSSTCKTATHSVQGCCSSHGGVRNCVTEGNYLFTSEGRLVCNDGSNSPSCTY